MAEKEPENFQEPPGLSTRAEPQFLHLEAMERELYASK